ncbi:zinc ABC transporter ATP-binding protein ZnuC [Gilvimarinus sp. F26214L]|uniref:zinc ABC transporter ATP-binding protein ZnuC n=1 Tax=Gilvimarinus sp. DZF01 TaxID=3461371 RepID=UPI004045703B
MTSVLVSAEHVGVHRNGRELLSDVNLSVSRGEMVTLIGPNGAGKSTLVRTILGLLKPDRGRVTRAQNLRIGYMPQQVAIDPSLPLTVERFLTLPGNNPAQLTRCLERTGTNHLRRQPVQALSGGEMQRVLLARALYRSPELLVLDEPVQGVDVSGQAALYGLIGQIKHELHCGVLMVSHDLHLVMAATDRVICLNQHICCEGSPDSVSSSPEFLKLFGESRSVGIARYTHHHDHTHDSPEPPVEKN